VLTRAARRAGESDAASDSSLEDEPLGGEGAVEGAQASGALPIRSRAGQVDANEQGTAAPGAALLVSTSGGVGPPATRAAALTAAGGAGVAARNAAAAAYAARVHEPQYTAAERAALDLLVQRSIAKPLDLRDMVKAVTWQRVTSFDRTRALSPDGLAGYAGTGGAWGSGACGKRTPAHSDRPLAEQAAPGGSASPRDVPISGGARPPAWLQAAWHRLYQRRAFSAAEHACCACASAVLSWVTLCSVFVPGACKMRQTAACRPQGSKQHA